MSAALNCAMARGLFALLLHPTMFDEAEGAD